MNPMEQARTFRLPRLSAFALHLIAMALMLGDHLWATFLPQHDWLTAAGRLAFPIFAFLLVEGFCRTGDLKKYMQRLLLAALVSEIPFNLIMSRRLTDPLHQNVLWSFLLSLLALSALKRMKDRPLWQRIPGSFLAVLAFYALGFLTFVDYYGYGILTVVLFYLTRPGEDASRGMRRVMMAVQAAALLWLNTEVMKGLQIPITLFGTTFLFHRQGLAVLALPLIWLYDGRQGPHRPWIRWVFYLFYPVHLFLLGGLLAVL